MSNEKIKELAHEILLSGQSRFFDPTLEEKIATALTTARQEARAEAFKDAIEIASRHREHSGYTLHQHGSESLDCRNVIWRELEAAAATTQKGRGMMTENDNNAECSCCGEQNCECGPYVADGSKVIDDPCRRCGKCINHCPHQ